MADSSFLQSLRTRFFGAAQPETPPVQRIAMRPYEGITIARKIDGKVDNFAPLVALGFRIGPDVDNTLFQAELPPGWQQIGRESILDETGTERVQAFTKFTPWDRSGHTETYERFSLSVTATNHLGMGREMLSIVLRDRQKKDEFVVEAFPVISRIASQDRTAQQYVVPLTEAFQKQNKSKYSAMYDLGDLLEEKSKKLFAEAFPDAASPAAYWHQDVKPLRDGLEFALGAMVRKLRMDKKKLIAKADLSVAETAPIRSGAAIDRQFSRP